MRLIVLAMALVAAPAVLSPALAEPAAEAAKDARPGLFVKQGETWFFKIKDGQHADPRQGSDDDKPGSDEIRVSLDGGNMIVLNGSPVAYNYQAFIAKKPSDKGNRTSVCTLIPGAMMHEIWPGNLPGIRLTNFSEADETMGCF